MRAQNDSQTCNSRFCPVNTEASGSGTMVLPSKTVDVRKVSPSDVAPDAMDTSMIGRDWKLRREFAGKRTNERKNNKAAPVHRGQVRSAGAASQIKLVMALKQYKAAGVEYSMISDFFANALSEADLSRPAEYIAREILVKDNQELKKSNKCYDQVINKFKKHF